MPQADARNTVTISLVVVGLSVIAVTGVWRNVADWVRAKSSGTSGTGAGGLLDTGVGITPIVVNAGEQDPNPQQAPASGSGLTDSSGRVYPGISSTATGAGWADPWQKITDLFQAITKGPF